ncbi:aminotransferase class I/II-fold pyridoxal phosphate-dependent enzyme [Candidatus Roizmanbacteria bacterium]|nr:aminotransferase class I/II-fold pyridoxal phosphate-dependent enzyme [Candidatus Roizmanbacteria bacterium]
MKFANNSVDEIFQLNEEFKHNSRKDKINGGIGIYLDEEGKPFVIPVVKKAISLMHFDNFNYLPLSGDPTFLKETCQIMLGKNLFLDKENLISKQGVMGGTNGLYIWSMFIKQLYKRPTIIIATPTWENHQRIFSHHKFKIISFNHLDKNGSFNIKALERQLKRHPESEVLFQAGSTHNPTGINPSKDQWDQIANLIQENKNKVLFDFAYMGLGNNIDQDSFAIRLFTKKKIPISVVLSFSKNMTLYQNRTGALFIFSKTKREKNAIDERLKYFFRIVNSNPSAFGELVVKVILESRELKTEWIKSLQQMVNSLKKRREFFAKYTAGQFDFVKQGEGLFSLLGLNQPQIKTLKIKYGIFLLSNSRLNFGGLSLASIPKVAEAILSLSQAFSDYPSSRYQV